MIAGADALSKLFALAAPLPAEEVSRVDGSGRVLAVPVAARLTQPPFDASAMDGYAVIAAEVRPGATFRVIGTAQAGTAFAGEVGPGEAVRIFTGSPVPKGATRIVLQEDVTREGDTVTIGDRVDTGPHIRPAGQDFAFGQELSAPRRLTPSDIALLAAMNIPRLPVTRRPEVAIIATGDELVQPGETPGPDQIIASNSYGIAARLAAAGAVPRLLPIARDTVESLRFTFDLARGADLVITIGGASVGDYDLVGDVARDLGMEQSFYKVAMRPGKPLMAGRMGPDHGGAMMIGLPGNPVSAMVCTEIFVVPVINKMLGLGARPAPRETVRLDSDLAANGPREHYMRAHAGPDSVRVFDRQDSALLTVLSQSNCMIVRPPNDPARAVGDPVEIIRI